MLVLFLPPSSQTTLYHSMYAFGNHIHVGSVEGTLTTVNCDVSATFSQHCRSNVCNKYLKAANLEYVGWVEVILAVDYGRYGLIVLCCIVIGWWQTCLGKMLLWSEMIKVLASWSSTNSCHYWWNLLHFHSMLNKFSLRMTWTILDESWFFDKSQWEQKLFSTKTPCQT